MCHQGLQNFGLGNILATYMRGLESEGVEWGAELRELRFQAAWRNTQWDCELSERWGRGICVVTVAFVSFESILYLVPFIVFCVRSEKSNPGFHESVFCALQALRDKEFSLFDETLKQTRCGGNIKWQT